MKIFPLPERAARGASLIEAIVAVGVLAVAIPLVFGTLAESGKSGVSSQVETRTSWIVPACLEEVQASREGSARYFTNTVAGEEIAMGGEPWALAFSVEGKPLGKLSRSDYEKGIQKLDGEVVRYIAAISAEKLPRKANTTPMLRLKISIEYPAVAPPEKRQKVDFYSRIP